MCGRYTHRQTWCQIHDDYRITEPEIGPGEPEPEIKPRYNMAPTQTAPVVCMSKDGKRELAILRWGLIPFWAKDAKIAYKTINARAETVATQPAFRAAFKARRCLAPASGFYEWKKLPDGSKQPYLFGMRDEARPLGRLADRDRSGHLAGDAAAVPGAADEGLPDQQEGQQPKERHARHHRAAGIGRPGNDRSSGDGSAFVTPMRAACSIHGSGQSGIAHTPATPRAPQLPHLMTR